MTESNPTCTNLEEILQDLLKEMSPEGVSKFRDLPKDSVIGRCHHGLGLYIRNRYFHLYPELVKAVGTYYPDGASTIVLEALWERLQSSEGEVVHE